MATANKSFYQGRLRAQRTLADELTSTGLLGKTPGRQPHLRLMRVFGESHPDVRLQLEVFTRVLMPLE